MGLKPGNHEFRMDVDPEFFACFPESEIQSAQGILDVVLEYKESTIVQGDNHPFKSFMFCGSKLFFKNFQCHESGTLLEDG